MDLFIQPVRDIDRAAFKRCDQDPGMKEKKKDPAVATAMGSTKNNTVLIYQKKKGNSRAF